MKRQRAFRLILFLAMLMACQYLLLHLLRGAPSVEDVLAVARLFSTWPLMNVVIWSLETLGIWPFLFLGLVCNVLPAWGLLVLGRRYARSRRARHPSHRPHPAMRAGSPAKRRAGVLTAARKGLFSRLDGFLTPRGLAFLLLGTPLIAAGGLGRAWLHLGLLVAGAVVALIVVDWSISLQPSDLQARRTHEPRLSLGADNRIQVHLRNRASRAVEVWVRDELPAEFDLNEEQRVLATRLPPHGETTLVYHARPTQRGDYEFGALNLRWKSALGLVVRQAAYPARAPVQVYPNLLKIRAYDLLVRRGRLDKIGLRPLRRFGEGSEFEQLRDYSPDDDYRRISWKATARHAKPITVEFQAERSQDILAVIDAGRQMMARSASTGLTRLDAVVNAVLLFSYVATQLGDRVGLLTFGDSVFAYLAPRPGRRQFQRILESLYRVKAQPVEPDYARACKFLRSRQQRRALVVLFTDPGSDVAAQSLGAYLDMLCPHHLPLCVTLGDPNVLTAARQTPRDVLAVYERAVAQQLLDERQVWLKKLARRGVLTLDASPDQLTPAVINQYLEVKGRGRL